MSATTNGNGTNNLPPLRQTPLTCSGHTRPVVDLAFSDLNPEDDAAYYCISACKDGKPMLRQGDTGDWIGTFEGHKGAVWGVDLNRDASRAATGAADFSAKVWDAVAGEERLTLQHKHIVKSVKFSRDGKRLATASNDKLLRIFDLEKEGGGPEPVLTFRGHTSGIKQVLFAPSPAGGDPDGRLISGADDKTLRIWDARTGSETRKIDLGGAVGGLELTRDNGDDGSKGILTVAAGKKVVFFDTKNFERIKEIDIPCPVYSASLHPDRKIFVCGGDDFKLYKYDFESGTEIESFKGHFGPVHCVRFSPDGELYTSGSEDGTLRLWQTEVGKNYGLWRCVDSISSEAVANPTKVEVTAS